MKKALPFFIGLLTFTGIGTWVYSAHSHILGIIILVSTLWWMALVYSWEYQKAKRILKPSGKILYEPVDILDTSKGYMFKFVCENKDLRQAIKDGYMLIDVIPDIFIDDTENNDF